MFNDWSYFCFWLLLLFLAFFFWNCKLISLQEKKTIVIFSLNWIISWNINNRGVNFYWMTARFFSICCYLYFYWKNWSNSALALACTPSNGWAINNPFDHTTHIDCLGKKGTVWFDMFLDFERVKQFLPKKTNFPLERLCWKWTTTTLGNIRIMQPLSGQN